MKVIVVLLNRQFDERLLRHFLLRAVICGTEGVGSDQGSFYFIF